MIFNLVSIYFESNGTINRQGSIKMSRNGFKGNPIYETEEITVSVMLGLPQLLLICSQMS